MNIGGEKKIPMADDDQQWGELLAGREAQGVSPSTRIEAETNFPSE